MMNMTTTISPTAAEAREAARTSGGQFGTQTHTAPEMSIAPAATYQEATGPEVDVISIATGDGYEQFTIAEARELLRIPDTESDETVLDVAHLLSTAAQDLRDNGEEYPPFVTQEPTYANPGDDAVISAGHWLSPAAGVTWEEAIPTWDNGDGRLYMIPAAVLDPAQFGFTPEQSDALDAIVSDHAAAHSDLEADCTSIGADGKLRLYMAQGFTQREYVPRIVERRFAELYARIDPEQTIREIKESGVILDNATLASAMKIDNARAIAYAAAHGRTPTDAEAVAILRTFRVTSTLVDGYLHPSAGEIGKFSDRTSEADKGIVQSALNTWYDNRKGSR